MTPDRDKIARELAEKLGIETSVSGSWFQMTGIGCEYISESVRDALIDAHCRIEELESDGWVRVEDGLPEAGKIVLIYTINKVIESAWLNDDGEFQLERTEPGDSLIYLEAEQTTHWRRLPAPPVAEEKSNG